jgi:exopolyphosphatase/guanosine-5'-triphosphate,3'-diphosphate pyrophosphatase
VAPEPSSDSSPVAAVDLGSNSFHLILARVVSDHLAVQDRLRDPVRLGAGIDEDGRLSDEALERMLTSLRRFRERLAHLAPDRIRAVGTDTFRRIRTPANALALASKALGAPIETLPGAEEARLIFLGVAQEEPTVSGRRLVLDVGGGSTECALGRQSTATLLDSLYMGCVNYTRRFFPDGKLTRKAFRSAEVAAKLELEPMARRYQEAGWEEAVGTSGTLNAIAEIARANGWSDGSLSLTEIKRLRRDLIAAERHTNLDLPGLSPERAEVLAGGLAIVKALFESLGIERLRTSKAALREGVLHDLLGRIRHEDARDRTIRSLSERYHVDADQAERVERTARRCLDQVAKAWNLDEGHARLLSWAAHLHEIGLALAYNGHHKHGAYLLENSDMPGFSRQEQIELAALVRGHRRKLSRALFADLASADPEALFRCCVLLRLAVRLRRSRTPRPLPTLELRPTEDGLEIRLPRTWLERRPLTSADLAEEDQFLSAAGLRLHVRGV